MLRAGSVIFIILLLFVSVGGAETPQKKDHSEDGKIKWEEWSDSVFERAKRENRFVLLDLEAVWCHWCHVMDDITYKDPDVISLINSSYIAVRVDQDSRPDLSNRYEDYGWPATIVFNGKGEELVKRSGYLAPKEMASMLKAIIADPTPGPSVGPEAKINYSSNPFLSPLLKRKLHRSYLQSYDRKYGSWGFVHKYLEWNSVEYSMALARDGNALAKRMVQQTLKAQLALLDPAWGGVYQYSTGGRWNEPHFEKIMQMQAENMRIYSLGYQMYGDPAYLKAAQEIHRFLKTFLMSPEGAFYTSQDADLVKGKHSEEYFALSDEERRKLGVPRIDKNIYSRENGWAINALVSLYNASGDEQYLKDAIKAAEWIIENRSLPGGGFRHDEKDSGGPFLGDSLAMAQAFLSLHVSTGSRQWLARAEDATKFIIDHFKYDNGRAGLATAHIAREIASNIQPKPQRDENAAMARFANMLRHYTGKAEYKELAETAMRYIATAEIASKRPTAGALLANLEMTADPVHITIVGGKGDPKAQALHKAALSYPSSYKRIDWWDKSEGPLPNNDVEYPELDKAAAFACASKRCSLPAFKPEDVRLRVDKLNGK